MKKRELLRKYQDLAANNLMCYSSSLSMTKSKEGFETEWEKAKTECELLKVMIDELPLEKHGDRCTFNFIGTVDSWRGNFSKVNKEHFMESLVVSDADGNVRMFEIDYEAGKELLRAYDEERHRRYDLGMNTDIVFTVRNSSQTVIKWEWKVKRAEEK